MTSFSGLADSKTDAPPIVALIASAFLLAFATQMISAEPGTRISLAAQWPSHGGSGGQQYSALNQINKASLDKLALAWTTRTGELGQGFVDNNFSFQANPVFWDRRLFVSTATGVTLAFNAATGEELWRYSAIIPKDANYSESAW